MKCSTFAHQVRKFETLQKKKKKKREEEKNQSRDLKIMTALGPEYNQTKSFWELTDCL